MSEQLEFEAWPTMTQGFPAFSQILTDRQTENKKGFDPHKLMVKKKQVLNGEVNDIPRVPERQWPEHDIQTLSEFCKKHGIIGFNCGTMSPIAALAMLKQKLGLVDEERVTYSQAMTKKTLLNG
jgi:hypothetical protein